MFDKFSEKARLVIFFARGQASVFGTQEITPEFLLLGMLQQRPPLELSRLIGGDADHWDSLRKQIEEDIPRGNPVPLSADIPLSEELGRVFQYAIEELSGTGLETVQPGHLVIGILREEGCHAAELLRENGADLGLARQRMLKPQ
jgi:ATP-dependent Clp protease ATP-binding subunit ClpC